MSLMEFWPFSIATLLAWNVVPPPDKGIRETSRSALVAIDNLGRNARERSRDYIPGIPDSKFRISVAIVNSVKPPV
jgi:hypothetical protein